MGTRRGSSRKLITQGRSLARQQVAAKLTEECALPLRRWPWPPPALPEGAGGNAGGLPPPRASSCEADDVAGPSMGNSTMRRAGARRPEWRLIRHRRWLQLRVLASHHHARAMEGV